MKYLSILMVGVAFLVGGCGEKEVPDNKTTKQDSLDQPPESKQELIAKEKKSHSDRETNEAPESKQPKTIDSENYPEKDQKNVVVEDDLVKRGLTTYIRNTDQPFIGTATRYYEDGSKHRETPYEVGRKHGVSIGFHREGYKWSETPYVEGKIHGTVISYRKDGSKQKETPYVKNKRHGTLITFRDDGSKNSEYPYVNGNLHGTANLYRSDGSKYQEEVYSKGKKISAKGWDNDDKLIYNKTF